MGVKRGFGGAFWGVLVTSVPPGSEARTSGAEARDFLAAGRGAKAPLFHVIFNIFHVV